MLKKLIPYIFVLIFLGWHSDLSGQDRFPRPEFESEYSYPEQQIPLQRSYLRNYVDV
ncbi:MAG: hypothetical protein GX158_08360, partial [Bacteroidales bacterium]|nr:hypothetical protein [Bacteroidales bacterium]